MSVPETTRRAGSVAADQHAAANSGRQGAAVSTTATRRAAMAAAIWALSSAALAASGCVDHPTDDADMLESLAGLIDSDGNRIPNYSFQSAFLRRLAAKLRSAR